MSTLVTYFSAGGRTAAIAREFAGKVGADLFEIKPQVPYTEADLKYINPLARCNKEQLSKKEVPVAGSVEDFSKYDTVYIGFPIWYAGAPKVVRSFCKNYDWSGKNVHLFATSMASGIGKTAEKLTPFLSGVKSVDAKLVHGVDEI